MEDGLCHRVTHKRTSKIHNAVSIVNTDKHFFLIKKKKKKKAYNLYTDTYTKTVGSTLCPTFP